MATIRRPRSPRKELTGKDYFRVGDVATKMDVSNATVYGLIKKGELAALRFRGMLQIHRQGLEAFIKRNSHGGVLSTSGEQEMQ